MNYIGSKLKLCQEFIPNTIKAVCGADLSKKVFCDIFAGTGIVGRTFKSSVQKIIANDLEFYSFVLNKNYIQNHIEFDDKDKLILELNNLEPKKGFVFENYCPSGFAKRQYFSDDNGARIDSIRQKIQSWKDCKKISESKYYFLLCSLIESADKVANTASVYGAYLKNFKKSAQKPLILESANFEINHNEHEVFNMDSNELIKHIQGDILYLDPPYNARQYGANYHLLNTIARYDTFTPQGKTGLRKYEKSKYCSRDLAQAQLENLIANARFKYVFLSYNNEGLINAQDIKKIMSKYGRYDLATTQYQRFKADSKRVNKANSTIEFLHILEKE